MKLIFRLLFIPVTAFFLICIMRTFDRVLFAFLDSYYDLSSGLYNYLDIVRTVMLAFFVGWIVLQFVFEIAAFYRKDFADSRWIKHLRYAPMAAIFSAFFITAVFDFAMIRYSKWQINNYVYSNSESVAEPDFDVHVNYRGWCGNGYLSTLSDLYFEDASAGLNSDRADIRARSLLMTFKIRGDLSESDYKVFKNALKASCLDNDVIVSNIAEKYLSDSYTSCKQFIDEK